MREIELWRRNELNVAVRAGVNVKVDGEDYANLSGRRWYVPTRAWPKPYDHGTFLLREVLGAGVMVIVRNRDGDVYDCQKSNLVVAVGFADLTWYELTAMIEPEATGHIIRVDSGSYLLVVPGPIEQRRVLHFNSGDDAARRLKVIEAATAARQ